MSKTTQEAELLRPAQQRTGALRSQDRGVDTNRMIRSLYKNVLPGEGVSYRGDACWPRPRSFWTFWAWRPCGGHAGRNVSGKLVPEYEALADAVGYALDLADFSYAAEAPIFAAMEHLDDH